MSDITVAVQIAAEAHRGQKDKSGQPYILHPMRVMASLSNEEDQIVGALHDVIEDSHFDYCDIAMAGFGHNITTALRSLTRIEGESYADFILRCKANPIARRVKISDIRDNLRPGASHLRDRYEAALKVLTEEIE